MSSKKASQNSPEDVDRDCVDHEGLAWALGRIHEWRGRVDNRTKIDGVSLGQQMATLAERGVRESLLGFVILGCEWMFRLRSSRPGDVEIVLARIEGRLRPVLHEHAWLITEALAPSVRKLLKPQRVLAPEFEDMPREVFVVTQPGASGVSDSFDVGYVAPLRTPPGPLIRARRGPAPKLAPWIVGVIAERLMDKQKEDGQGSTSEAQDLIVELISALCGREIDKQEYIVRRRCLQVQELDNLVESFTGSHDQFVAWDPPPWVGDRPDWFRVVRTRVQKFGLRDTFPYDLQIVTAMVQAYGTSPARRRASSGRGRAAVPRSPRSGGHGRE